MITDRRAPIPERHPATWAQVLNPFWWMSDTQRNMNFTWIHWFIINPCCNACAVIFGISHRSRTVAWARGTGWTYVDGWNWGWVKADESNLKFPFISHRGRWIEWMAGWKTSGALGISCRIARAKNPGPHP